MERISDGGGDSPQWECLEWHAPPKHMLMQTVLHLAALALSVSGKYLV